MSSTENGKRFSTLDSYLAGFLVLLSFIPELISQRSGKVAFVFDASPALYEAIAAYQNGAQVDAFRFALAVKGLKTQIFSKKENDVYANNYR